MHANTHAHTQSISATIVNDDAKASSFSTSRFYFSFLLSPYFCRENTRFLKNFYFSIRKKEKKERDLHRRSWRTIHRMLQASTVIIVVTIRNFIIAVRYAVYVC